MQASQMWNPLVFPMANVVFSGGEFSSCNKSLSLGSSQNGLFDSDCDDSFVCY